MNTLQQPAAEGLKAPSKPKKIYVNQAEMERDNGSTLVFRTREGKLHEIYGACGEVTMVPEGYKSIYAVSVKIAGRIVSLYQEAVTSE